MERKYVCIDCGKEFIVESRRATHAKRCPVCRKLHRRSYDKQWKINKRLLDPEYAANMQNSYVKKKFLEDPISFLRVMIAGVKIVKTALNLSKYESSSDRGF